MFKKKKEFGATHTHLVITNNNNLDAQVSYIRNKLRKVRQVVI